jgi:V8-like Glu-specific endopeptidase
MIATTALMAFSVLTVNASMDKGIYGDDNRLDIFETTNETHLKLATATVGLFKSYSFEETRSGEMKIKGSKMKLCSDAKFNGQLAAAFCSGFLVEHEDVQYLVTAGHCIATQADCKKTKFVFDFAITSSDQNEHIVKKTSIYSCDQLVDRQLSRGNSNDYAVVKLNREVTDREVAPFRTSGKINDGEELLVIGHPSGLPTKVAGDAYVRNNSNNTYFSANLDTFGGNSGSAVFNARTGEVEGILVRGDTDYEYKRGPDGKRCQAPVECKMDGCRGEDVTRMSSIKYFNY